MILTEHEEDGWCIFVCCARCAINDCEPDYVRFNEEDLQRIQSMSDEERKQITTFDLYTKNDVGYLRPKKIDWEEELRKCKESPYYFATKYCQVEGKPYSTSLSEEVFNDVFRALSNQHYKPRR